MGKWQNETVWDEPCKDIAEIAPKAAKMTKRSVMHEMWSCRNSIGELISTSHRTFDTLERVYRVAHKKRNSRYSRFFRSLLWSTVIFFTLLNRASFPHYNNTKIIKFGWELFISWVISDGLSFSGFARFPEFRGTINDKLMANPENDSP